MNLDLKKIRKDLNGLAEISGKEVRTREYIRTILETLGPDGLFELHGSLIAVFGEHAPGGAVGFRADIDALPVNAGGAAHLCGHDGHAAILLGLAEHVSANRPEKGAAVLVFQSAEETGQGAKALVSDQRFKSLGIKKMYGYHNLPGLEEGKIYLARNNFASASVGLTVSFTGRTSHASEPEKGISPVPAVTDMISFASALNKDSGKMSGSGKLITVVGVKAGGKDFGMSPSSGEVYMTLRSHYDGELQKMRLLLEEKSAEISNLYGVQSDYEYSEYFPALENSLELTAEMVKLLEGLHQPYSYLDKPYFWSEDFAFYKELSGLCFFGIGSGAAHTHLHSQDYDFNDNISDTAVRVLERIYDMNKRDLHEI